MTRTVEEIELDRTWTYGPDVQHGGHLLERVTAVALQGAGHPDPLAVSAHFLAAPRLGTAQVHRDVLRAGRSVSTLRAQLVQGGRTCLDVVVTAGTLGEPGVPSYAPGGAARPAAGRAVSPHDDAGRAAALRCAGTRQGGGPMFARQQPLRFGKAATARVLERTQGLRALSGRHTFTIQHELRID